MAAESDDAVALIDVAAIAVCIDAVADGDAVTSAAVGDLPADVVYIDDVADFLLMVSLFLLQFSAVEIF